MSQQPYYYVEIRHDGLGKYQRIKDKNKYVCEQKANSKLSQWDDMWQRRLVQERKTKERADKSAAIEQKKNTAVERTQEAVAALNGIDETLRHTLGINDAIDWDSLKDHTAFSKPKPTEPKPASLPFEPKENEPVFQPQFSLADKFSSKKREAKIAAAHVDYESAHTRWNAEKDRIIKKTEELKKEHDSEVEEWEKEKADYHAEQAERNLQIDEQQKAYEAGEPDAIASYCDLVLTNSQYPDYFPKEWDLDYNPANKILIVDYSIPDLDTMPRLKDVKYVQSRDEFKETLLGESAVQKMYDDLLYKLALRTVHELFESDTVNALDAVVFNGWVNHIDKATGQQENACVLTVQVQKEELMSINLANIDPKACFKNLKGVGSSKLHTITPVAPLLTIDKEDRRFVSAYSVTGDIDDSTNLAAMDWEDFEHLIRELFEKEFSSNGGEVKITQASRDGGVDAVAFDPDPIRGGKIVIQAKRYTNTVGVAAVRDLYGTVVNEGATKGILVTTADYGPDAYNFAKGKPLTLLSGGNLLHLLEKHGHNARIDLKEAKLLLSEQEQNS
ncbi:MAG: restriction endonuclease [Thermoleophilia bacterium]